MTSKTGSLLSAPGSVLSAADHPDAVKDGKMGRLQAFDVSGKKLGWTHDLDAPLSTSALATAGGVVFTGDLDPSLKAFDDRDGKLLWSAPLPNAPSSSVITYTVGQTQYVAVVVGMRNNHINDLLRRYQAFRKARGLTLKQMARRTNLSVSLLSQIERAESSASVSSLFKVATALDVRLTDLFGGY